MSKFGKALKPINIDQLMVDIQRDIQKPKKYRPKMMTEEEHKIRRKKSKIHIRKKQKRNLHGYTIYYDRFRKGWFYRDEDGNRYGIRGSKDKGFSHKKNAIDALQRRWRKQQKEKDGGVGPDIPPDYPDPVPVPEGIDDIIIQYDRDCNAVRRAYYGKSAPSDSLYIEIFNGFEEQYPIVNLKGWTRTEIEKQDSNSFSVKALLDYKDIEPIYMESNGEEFIVGLSDIVLVW